MEFVVEMQVDEADVLVCVRQMYWCVCQFAVTFQRGGAEVGESWYIPHLRVSHIEKNRRFSHIGKKRKVSHIGRKRTVWWDT